MWENWKNAMIWACECKRPMNHDRKQQERKFSIIAIAIIAFVILFMVLSFVGCKTQDCIPETIIKDSVRLEYKLDSTYIYEKDSVFIKEKADTVFVEKWKTRYKDVLKIERDTIYQENKVVEVKEVKYIPSFVKVMAWIGGGLTLLLLIWGVLKVYRRFVLKV